MSNILKGAPEYDGNQREEEQVTATKKTVDGKNKNALDVYIVGENNGIDPMVCESGVIDLVGNIELTVNTTKFTNEICSVEFFDDTMRKILITYRILGTNQFRVQSNNNKTAVIWKAQGV